VSDFTHIKSLVLKAANKWNMGGQVRAAAVCERFRKLCLEKFGDGALEKIRTKYYKNHTLYIETRSAGWNQKVNEKKKEIIEELNEQCDVKVKDIRVGLF